MAAAKLSDTDKQLAGVLRRAGWSLRAIADEFGVSSDAIYRHTCTPEARAAYLAKQKAYKARHREVIAEQQKRYRMGLGTRATQTMPFYGTIDY
jgi:transposase